MAEAVSIDGKKIRIHKGRYNAPPPFDHGGMDSVGIAVWVQVDEDWYRWTGRNTVLLQEFISEASLVEADDWVNIFGEDMERWNA